MDKTGLHLIKIDQIKIDHLDPNLQGAFLVTYTIQTTTLKTNYKSRKSNRYPTSYIGEAEKQKQPSFTVNRPTENKPTYTHSSIYCKYYSFIKPNPLNSRSLLVRERKPCELPTGIQQSLPLGSSQRQLLISTETSFANRNTTYTTHYAVRYIITMTQGYPTNLENLSNKKETD